MFYKKHATSHIVGGSFENRRVHSDGNKRHMMVLILDVNSEQNSICDCFRFTQMPETDQITDCF